MKPGDTVIIIVKPFKGDKGKIISIETGPGKIIYHIKLNDKRIYKFYKNEFSIEN